MTTQVHQVCRWAAVTTALIWGASTVPAQEYFVDQPPNATNSGFSDLSCGVCGDTSVRVAEDFVLAAPATVLEVELWGGYALDQEFPDAFTLEIYADASGVPANSPLASASGLTPVIEITTGTQLPTMQHRHIFVLRLLTPLALPAGTYWVMIANDSTGQLGDFLWESGDPDLTNGLPGSVTSFGGGAWVAFAPDYAFAIPVVLFADGFESGDVNDWSASAP